MKEPQWYRGWQGERRALPQSERQGVELARKVLIPLNAQIAVFFGKAIGDLETLQEGVMKLYKGEPIVCESCGRNVWAEHHRSDCEIALRYDDVRKGEPAPLEPRTSAGYLERKSD